MRKINVFGKVMSFPADASNEEIEIFLNENEHLLDPNYKKPLTDKVKDFAKDVYGYGKPSISEQAEATAPDSSEIVAPKMRGAPVRQSVYNQALLEQLPGDESSIQNRINKTANLDLSGQRLQTGIKNSINDAAPYPEGGFVASAKSVTGQTIKGVGRLGSDYFDWDQDNAISAYGQKLIDENPLAVKELGDIKESPGVAVSEALGNSAPSMAGMVGVKALGMGISSLAPLTGPLAPIVMATGKAVEWLGPAAIAALPSYSGIRDKQILNDPKNEADAKSKAIAGIGAAAVGAIEIAFGPQQWALAMMTKEGRAAISRKFASTTVGGAMIKGAAKGAAVEGAEELVQNPIEQLSSYDNPLDKKNIEETLFGGTMGAIGGGVMGGGAGVAVQAERNIRAEGLRMARNAARDKAQNINQQTSQQDINDITNAKTVDEAISAAEKATARSPVTENDIHRAADPTLADIERLTGLKPTEAIDQAIAEARQQASGIQQKEINRSIAGAHSAPNLENPRNKTTGISDIVLPDGTTLQAQWDVVDADSISASIKEGVNQPRDRTRVASDIQIQGIANNPDYRRLSDSPVMDVGAPVLSHDNLIVGGNGRFEGISRSHDIGSAGDYLANLKDDALNKGIDPAIIDAMKKPVLVRRITQPFDARKLAIASNSGGGLQYSGLELAKIDSERMKGIEDLDVTDSGDIALTASNFGKLKQSLGDYNATEIAAFTDDKGGISQDGVRRIRNAMLAKAYGSSDTLGRLVESTDTDMRNVLGALTKSASAVAKARANIAAGAAPKEIDATDNLLEAVETFSQIRSKGQPLDNYLAQQSLFGDDIDPDSKEILQFLHDNVRSQKRLAEFIKSVYDQISSIDQTTSNLFGDEAPPTKLELIENAKQRTANGQQQHIFQAGTDNQAGQPNEQQSKVKTDNARGSKENERVENENIPPISVLKKIYVNIPIVDSNGNEITYKGAQELHPGRTRADIALAEVDDRISLIKQLIGCMNA